MNEAQSILHIIDCHTYWTVDVIDNCNAKYLCKHVKSIMRTKYSYNSSACNHAYDLAHDFGYEKLYIQQNNLLANKISDHRKIQIRINKKKVESEYLNTSLELFVTQDFLQKLKVINDIFEVCLFT